ncbi:hypothetical protein PRECH8_06010 [Insulibacter thermoxylanivorax]|uniref:Uncharacterized protein n=1 Tax=Insulibacter thermoxylanivorax TaxID=2749268 RepID=A0A916QAX2_9BACL|nr:DUF2398 family protein [Insulibacter thermoxylanivorax]GFR37305.1 hypothetical protein PRECH8_06010 [Insulibacter thermoxylanivorax]
MYEIEQRVQACKALYGAGWSKQYRTDTSAQEIARELIALWKEWKMADVDEETGMVILYPHLVRTIGRYPREFFVREDERGNDEYEA